MQSCFLAQFSQLKCLDNLIVSRQILIVFFLKKFEKIEREIQLNLDQRLFEPNFFWLEKKKTIRIDWVKFQFDSCWIYSAAHWITYKNIHMHAQHISTMCILSFVHTHILLFFHSLSFPSLTHTCPFFSVHIHRSLVFKCVYVSGNKRITLLHSHSTSKNERERS